MIWIEGKSTAWTYLSELELTPFMKIPENKAGEKPLSADEIERKAEELRQRVLSSAPRAYFPGHPVEVDSYGSPYKFPEDEIQFVDHRKERKMRNHTLIGELFLTCFVIGLFMVGIYKGRSFLGVKKAVHNSVATQLDTHDEHAAQKNKPVVSAPVVPVADTLTQTDSTEVAQTMRPKSSSVKRKFVDSVAKASALKIPPPTPEKKDEAKTETAVQVPEEIPVKEKLDSSVPEANKAAADHEEKKGFLRGLFKKKKKNDNTKDNKDE